MKGFFVTQASQQVGFGHLMECLAIAEEISHTDFSFLLFESDAEAYNLLQQNDLPVAAYDFSMPLKGCDWILLNTRTNDFKLQEDLYQKTDRLVLLDELGGKKLCCHSLINFSLNKDWHTYQPGDSKPELYLGPAYYPLRREIQQYSGHNYKKNSVFITLGGVDRSATVIRIAEYLVNKSAIHATYVLGPGCRVGLERLHKIINNRSNHQVVIAPDNFAELMAANEVVISSGGNTLYEAAYLGKGTLIIWEDDHERSQGECFERAGLAKIVGGPDSLDENLLAEILEDGFEAERRLVVDGKGVERICRVLFGY